MSAEVFERVKRIIVERLGVDEAEVTLEASLKMILALIPSMLWNWSWNWKMSLIWKSLMKTQRRLLR